MRFPLLFLVVALAFPAIALTRAGADGFAAAGSSARKAIPGPVEAQVTKVRDGDTVEVEAFIWPGQAVDVAVRLKGIDAPEHHGACPAEKRAALTAERRLRQLVGNGRVLLTDVSGGKYYGRVLGRLSKPHGTDIAETLLAEDLVARYGGGHRVDWCDGGLAALRRQYGRRF